MKSGFRMNALDRLEIRDDSKKPMSALKVEILLASHLTRSAMRPELCAV